MREKSITNKGFNAEKIKIQIERKKERKMNDKGKRLYMYCNQIDHLRY
jgi:hypothetical protein